MNSMTLPTRANADVIESAYRAWLDNPDSVDPTWRAFFQGFTLGNSGGSLAAAAGKNGSGTHDTAGISIIDSLRQSQVHSLVYHYRSFGHHQADLDPLSDPPAPSPRLQLSEFGLDGKDLDESFDVGHYLQGGQMRLRELIGNLQ